MSNPYLSLNTLSVLASLADTNHLMISIPGTGLGYVPLSEFRDSYLLTTVNSEIAALQAKPANGAFASPITMSFTGVVTGSVSFDGTSNVSAAMTMPDNSIPISAVTDLASTIATIESELGVASLLQSSYFSNIAAASQTTMLGYWNASTTGMTSQDPAGVVFEMSSDGTNAPASGNYVSQLLMGSAGTISWRRNTENGGWEQVQLWHTGNFTPSSYVAQNGTATLGSLAVASASAEADIFLSSNGSTAYQTYIYNSETTGIAGIAITNAAGAYAGPVISWDRQSGALSFSSNVTIPNGDGLLWPGGAILKTGAGGGTVIVQGAASGNIFAIDSSGGSQIVVWDPSGNQVSTANITTTGTIQGVHGIFSSNLVLGGTSAALATLDVVTASGHLIVEELSGSTTIASINADNTAYTILNIAASSTVFTNGSVTVDGNLTATGAAGFNGAAAGVGGSGFAANTGFGMLMARGTTGVNYWDSTNAANNSYQSLQINATAINLGANSTVSGTLTVNNSSTMTGAVVMNSGLQVNGSPLISSNGLFTSQFGALSPTHGQGAYIGWNYTGGQGETDFINNEGGGGGGFAWYNSNSAGTTVTSIMQLNGGGALTTVGVANFNTSDRRLKTNIKKHVVVPYHRKAPYFTYDRIDIDASGQGPMAQAIRRINPAHVNEYLHLNSETQQHVKRLAIDKTGIALEQAYWASYEVDDLRKLVNKLTKRLDAIEAKQKKY